MGWGLCVKTGDRFIADDCEINSF